MRSENWRLNSQVYKSVVTGACISNYTYRFGVALEKNKHM